MGVYFQGSSEEIYKYCIKGREICFQKGGSRNTLANSIRIHISSTEDESIFIYIVYLLEENYGFQKGTRPIVIVTGSHQRTCLFGTLTMDRRHLFRQYDLFNQQDTFLDYLKQINKRLGKVISFTDREQDNINQKRYKNI